LGILPGLALGFKGRRAFVDECAAVYKRQPAGPGPTLQCQVTVNTTASHENRETFGNTIGTSRKKG